MSESSSESSMADKQVRVYLKTHALISGMVNNKAILSVDGAFAVWNKNALVLTRADGGFTAIPSDNIALILSLPEEHLDVRRNHERVTER